jgi:hypothetical protein
MYCGTREGHNRRGLLSRWTHLKVTEAALLDTDCRLISVVQVTLLRLYLDADGRRIPATARPADTDFLPRRFWQESHVSVQQPVPVISDYFASSHDF